METRGLTGLIKFDRDGFRSNIQLDIVRLTEDGLMKIGEWNSTSSGSIEWMADGTKTADVDQKLQNKTFIVLISLTAPYGMQKESWMTLSGNDRYEGFGIDIIDEISKILEFNYTLQVEQSDYGSYNPIAKQWSGMLGKIMAGVSIVRQLSNFVTLRHILVCVRWSSPRRLLSKSDRKVSSPPPPLLNREV